MHNIKKVNDVQIAKQRYISRCFAWQIPKIEDETKYNKN